MPGREDWTVAANGSHVDIRIDCADAYAAIGLAETILQGVRDGALHLYWHRPPIPAPLVRPRLDWGDR